MTMTLPKLFAGLAVAFSLSVAPATADELETIKAAGEMRVAMTGAYPPFSMIDDNNQVVGFDADIGSEIARRLGVEPVIVTNAWDGILPSLLASKFDAVVGSMTITPQRQEVVDFVGPYYRSGRAMFVRQGESFSSLSDFSGRTVGVTLGETHEKWARTQDGWSINTYKGLPELLLELENGRIDAMVIDQIPGLVAIKDGKPIEQAELSDLPFDGSDNIGIAIRKGNPELAAAMQKALDDMQADGAYEAIAMKWIGRDIR
ncbi:MAG TPA: transporter substrate-binding domain-containing protein [Methylomirabilota bacterium]|nr:transporter substrate-binding domain-containing protein [Methylomirabilota bacterium]